ncbi:MAG: hypothetical protein EZS28_048882, partial [Streblomastix strix]
KNETIRKTIGLIIKGMESEDEDQQFDKDLDEEQEMIEIFGD